MATCKRAARHATRPATRLARNVERFGPIQHDFRWLLSAGQGTTKPVARSLFALVTKSGHMVLSCAENLGCLSILFLRGPVPYAVG